jgi:hypothetical protein
VSRDLLSERICSDSTLVSWTKLSRKRGPDFARMRNLLQEPGLQAIRQQLEPLRDALVNWLLQQAIRQDHEEAMGLYDGLAVDPQSLVSPAYHDRSLQICSPSALVPAEYAQRDYGVLPEATSWATWPPGLPRLSY